MRLAKYDAFSQTLKWETSLPILESIWTAKLGQSRRESLYEFLIVLSHCVLFQAHNRRLRKSAAKQVDAVKKDVQ